VAKHPPDPSKRQSIRQKRAPRRRRWPSIHQNRAAKHPPEHDQCNLDEVDDASQGRRRSRDSIESQRPPAADDHRKPSFQNDASREGATPKTLSSSDQKGQGFRPESLMEEREEVGRMTPSRR